MNPPVYLWGATMGGLLAVFALDFLRGSQNPRDPAPRACAIWSMFYILLALAFGLAVIGVSSAQGAGFFAEWIGAYTISIDTVFVLMLIMSALGVPHRYRKWVLLFALGLAFVLRSGLIAVGGAGSFPLGWLFVAFGALLIYGGWWLFERGERDEVPTPAEPESRKAGMLLALAAVIATDVVLAVNVVPTVSGVPGQAYLTWSANAFAVLALWRMYYLINGVLDRMVHAGTGQAAVLAFIGAQFVLEALLPHDLSREPGVLALSLGMIAVILVVTTITSRLSGPVRGLEPALSEDAVRIQRPQP